MSRHLRLKHPKVYRSVYPYLDKNPIKGPLYSTSWVKGSWAKKYCTRVSGKKYKCDMCVAVLSLSNGLFGNMKRHIKKKHPYIYEKEVGGGRSDEEFEPQKDNDDNEDTDELLSLSELIKDGEVNTRTDDDEEETTNSEFDTESQPANDIPFLNDNDPEFENKVKYLVTKQIGKKRAKNCFWNFFNVVKENHLYTCLACNRRVAIFPHSIANLKRHIKMRHKYQYQLIMKYIDESETIGKSSPMSFDKYYFDQEGDNEYKCKECGNVISCPEDDQHTLFDHIKNNHPDQIMAYQEESVDDNEQINVLVVKAESA